MYAVGSHLITMREGRTVPCGVAHAVDLDGDVLCGAGRPRYYFPWLGWMTEGAPAEERLASCPACTTVALERALPAAVGDDPYPAGAPATSMPAHSAMDWLRYPQDFTAWSAHDRRGLSQPPGAEPAGSRRDDLGAASAAAEPIDRAVVGE